MGFICRWEEPEIGEQQQFLAPIDDLTPEQASAITTHFHEILAIRPYLVIRALMGYHVERAGPPTKSPTYNGPSPDL